MSNNSGQQMLYRTVKIFKMPQQRVINIVIELPYFLPLSVSPSLPYIKPALFSFHLCILTFGQIELKT